MFSEVNGDLIQKAKNGHFDVIIHGCNCQKNMGAGLAKQIKRHFPLAEKADLEYLDPRMGDYSLAYDKRYNLFIINAYTQFWYGPPYGINEDKRQIYEFDRQGKRYGAIKRVLKKINDKFAGKRIGLPLIGAGLAGGNWEIIRSIIQEELNDCLVTIVHFKQ